LGVALVISHSCCCCSCQLCCLGLFLGLCLHTHITSATLSLCCHFFQKITGLFWPLPRPLPVHTVNISNPLNTLSFLSEDQRTFLAPSWLLPAHTQHQQPSHYVAIDHRTFLASSWLLPAHTDNIRNPLPMLQFLAVGHRTSAKFLYQTPGIIVIY
jgi:hypothetical protein